MSDLPRSSTEFLKIVRDELGLGPERIASHVVRSLVQALDDDGSASVGLNELVDFIARGAVTFGSGPETISEEVSDKIQKRMQRALKEHNGEPSDFFNQFDESGDGVLDAGEVRQMFRTQLKITPADVTDNDINIFVRALDDDGSGTLAIEELLDFLELGSATFFSGGAKKKAQIGPDWALRIALTAITNTGW